jgi:tRNA (cytidine/uridine-2'-O-)-methyltransferase
MLHIVLYEPEIPHNTGAVGRLALATGARLHLIHPLGFALDDRKLKRAGLDYWKDVDLREWASFDQLLQSPEAPRHFHYFTTKTTESYWDAPLAVEETALVFGPETRGLPESLLKASPETCWRIPMLDTRSLNLATAVGIVLYEAVRQRGGLTAAVS